MLKLWDFECPECGATSEQLVEDDEEPVPCLFCGKRMQRVPFTQGTAARAQVNPAKTREMFAKAQEMRNKVAGKTPWRRNSYSQVGNE
jgi:endogenous inhibitor of DNA gyrase (YacG/DUF329 family)